MPMSFYKNKLVLVTGGTGFVGGHIVDHLLEAGAWVRIPVHQRQPHRTAANIELVEADLTRTEDCLRCCRDVDFVFHAAGGVGAAGISQTQIIANITSNLTLTANALQSASEAKVKRILVFSSSTAYPPADHAVKEDEFWSADPWPGYHGYGWMRRYTERLAEYVHNSSDINVAIVRPGALYGPRDNFDLATCHVVPALIRKAVDRTHPFNVWGDGDDVRDFLHIADLARGCLMMLENKADCDPVNIAYGEGVVIRDLVKIIVEEAKYENASLEFDSSKPSALPIRLMNTEKAMRNINFQPKITIREGIRETIQWYQSVSQNSL